MTPVVCCPYFEDSPVKICKAFTGGLFSPGTERIAKFCANPSGYTGCMKYRVRKEEDETLLKEGDVIYNHLPDIPEDE